MRKNLALVSKHEIVRSNSHSRLEARDRETEILDLVSKHETERKKFSISSRDLKKASRYALGRPVFAKIDDFSEKIISDLKGWDGGEFWPI